MSPSGETTSEEGGLRGIVDQLYRLEPSGFTAARAAHAAEARRSGDRELARQISKLPRPSRAAFALNLLARERPGDMERLLQLAGSLRDASKRLAGSELRELGGSRQQMIAELTSTARRLAADSGAPVSGPTLEEIEESLQASLLDDKAARALTSGHLARPLRVAAIGTAELSEALPPLPIEPPGRGDRRPAESRARKAPSAKTGSGDAAGKAAADRLQEAEERARRAAKAAGAARTEVDRARRGRDGAVSRRQSAEAALASARRDELSSSKALRAAEAAHRRSESALEAAERSLRQVVERAGDGRRD